MHDPRKNITLSEIARALPEIRRNSENAEWMIENADYLYSLIRDHNKPEFLYDAAKALVLVARHFLYSRERDRWEKLLNRQLMLFMQAKDREYEQKMWNELGYYNLVSNRAGTAKLSFEKSLRMIDHEADRVDAHINIVKAAAFQPQEDNRHKYTELLQYARREPNQYTKALIYEAAAQYHVSKGSLTQTMGFAQTAYAIWFAYYQQRLFKEQPISNDLHRHLGVCLFLMTTASRMMGVTPLAERLILKAIEHFEKLPDVHDFKVAYYELGAIQLVKKDYAAAADSFNVLIDYSMERKMDVYTTLAMYNRGVALTHMGEYGRADLMLFGALEQWEKEKHWANIAQTQHAIGFMYLKQDDLTQAETWLNKAENTIAQIDGEGMREFVMKNLRVNLDDLEKRRKQGD